MSNSVVTHLSNQGFDIWLGNNRGNKYSCTNQKLDNDSAEFWDHSFQEMAEIDFPLFLETVKKITGRTKISVMAHSQGGTQVLASLSEFPEYQDSIGEHRNDFQVKP
jgi:lysosomal acid lipase/cholesteryl ester hydrolase